MGIKFKIRPVAKKDLRGVSRVLSDWLSEEEVRHYTESIQKIISASPSMPKFDSHYYAAISGEEIIGVAGFRMLNPRLLTFATTKTPAELCMLYVAREHCGGKGVGTALLNHVIDEVKKRKYEEIIIRSAEKFSDTGWGFYDHMGFDRVGQLSPSESEKMSQIWAKKISIASPEMFAG